ncbi:putative inner membrane transporter yiJE [Moorella mulderi DSM 14980]|uniref:Putative inner membrane transporter yiJE n=1 Tax=Moorella mulderi DSM 14980 TaxID=1122241 RepID=A0A151B0U8_9FIRM|nr:putative inner membrane transporter yiJE [Moorella mulderi DSM 14980]
MKAKHIYLLLLVTLIWGLTFPIMKIGSRYIPPVSFGAWRFFLGAACLCALAARRQGKIWHARQDFWPLMLLGLLQTTIMGGALHLGISLVKSGITSVVLYSYPFFFTFLAFLLLKENLTWKQVTGLIIGFAGLILVVNPWQVHLTRSEFLGILVLLGGSASWGLASVYLKAAFKNQDKLVVTAYQMLYGSLVLLPVAALADHGLRFSWTLPAIGIILYTSIFTSALGFAILLTIQARYPASQTSVYLFLVPVFGVTFSTLLLGEKLTLNLLLGLALVALGIITVNLGATAPARGKDGSVLVGK